MRTFSRAACIFRRRYNPAAIGGNKVGRVVFPAHDGRKEFVSQTVGEGELRRGPPRIHRIKRMARLEVGHDERRSEVWSGYGAEGGGRESERCARRGHSVHRMVSRR